MAEFTSIAAQTVANGANAILTETPVRGNGCITHREGSGLVNLRGITNQCRALYHIHMGANIAIADGGTVGPISIAISLDGEALGSATAIVTPAATGDFFNVSADAFVAVPAGCCSTVSVENISGQAITVSNLNVIAERVA